MKGRKFYISGPITGTDDYMERFARAEEYLKSKGYEVINPAKVNSMMPESTTWEEYMEMSLCMLGLCDAVYFLKGWEKSRGAMVEFMTARLNCDQYISVFEGREKGEL